MQRIALTLAGLMTLSLAGCPSGDGGGTGGTGGRGGTGGGGTGGGGTGGGGTGGSRPPDARRPDTARTPDTGRAPDRGRTPDTGQANDASRDTGGSAAASPMMSFFVTSVGAGEGGNLGGLDGADRKCQELAAAVGVGGKTWKAYLSTSTVNARDRIGNGPWRNSKGVVIANDLATLHDQQGMNGMLNATWPIGNMAVQVVLDEKGGVLPSGGNTGPQHHDVLTGSTAAGMVDGNNHCNNWTSSSMTLQATVGHSNRAGGGRPPSWNSAHADPTFCGPSNGNPNFAEGTVSGGGGRGSIYCFATN
jgi:hypothetical protein